MLFQRSSSHPSEKASQSRSHISPSAKLKKTSHNVSITGTVRRSGTLDMRGSLLNDDPNAALCEALSANATVAPVNKPRIPSVVFSDGTSSSGSSGSGSTDDDPFIIAHRDAHQPRINKLSTGVQWEIARLISRGKISYTDLSSDCLSELMGSSADVAPNVPKYFRLRKQEASLSQEEILKQQRLMDTYERAYGHGGSAKCPWSALDVEERYLNESQYALLGFQIGNDGIGGSCTSIPPDYYGGKVHFTGRIIEIDPSDSDPASERSTAAAGGSDSFRVELERATLGISTRFARRFGSSRFLKLSVPKRWKDWKKKEKLKELVVRPFVVNGAVYRMFFARDHTVFLVRTEERYSKRRIKPAPVGSNSPLRSLYAFMNWHNPMELNQSQNVAKWLDRFSLGLSNTVPGVLLDRANIRFIDDVYASGYNVKDTSKPPSEFVMTDGCGVANKAALDATRVRCRFETSPSAVHMRIGGAKGLLLLHCSNTVNNVNNVPKVWIRSSQVKVCHLPDKPLDPANLVIDVVRNPKVRTPCTISYEFILNMNANGVGPTPFIQLMKAEMKDLAEKLMTWDGEFAMQRLYKHVCDLGGLSSSALSRASGGRSKLHGFWERSNEDDVIVDDWGLLDDISSDVRPTSSWKDETSGNPASMEAKVAELLLAGFTPRNSRLCAETLFSILKLALSHFKKKYRITVPKSARAFIVPDPFGVLKRGEVFFSSTQPILGRDDLETNILLGEVLIGRNPCKLRSDIEKFVAVDNEKLRSGNYKDVVVFSIKDLHSPANRLSGGDYDGDEVVAIWQPEIVREFRNADLCLPPARLEQQFEQVKETVAEFLKRAPPEDSRDHIHELQAYMQHSLMRLAQTGAYNTMHLNSAHMYGYGDSRTARMGHIFCKCLDGAKAGVVGVKSYFFFKDKKDFYDFQPAQWQNMLPRRLAIRDNIPHLPRTTGKFVMEEILEAIESEEEHYIGKFKPYLSAPALSTLDDHLAKPWRDACARAERRDLRCDEQSESEDLTSIQQHVDGVFERRVHRFKELMNALEHHSAPRDVPGRLVFRELPLALRQDFEQSFPIEFVDGPSHIKLFDESKVRELCASYAYVRYHDNKSWWRFPWDVAFGTLCEMKAKAVSKDSCRHPVSVVPYFHDLMVMHRNVLLFE